MVELGTGITTVDFILPQSIKESFKNYWRRNLVGGHAYVYINNAADLTIEADATSAGFTETESSIMVKFSSMGDPILKVGSLPIHTRQHGGLARPQFR
jgi:hypothetical protein